MGRIRIGTSGWSYDSWRDDYYPRDLPRSRQLEYLSRRLDTAEVNGSFYSLLKPGTYRSWYDATPAPFRFAVKGNNYITHSKRLLDPETPLANFFASGVLELREKLGPILWQLPGSAEFDAGRTEAFLDRLPRDTREAARLARRHDDHVANAGTGPAGERHRLRHAVEVRHPSFLVPEFARLARRYGIAIVVSDAADWPRTEEITAGFVYVRLHGARETYASRYGDRSLDRWAERIRTWASAEEPDDAKRITDRGPPARRGRDVYVFFDNDREGHAPRDAERLARRTGSRPAS